MNTQWIGFILLITIAATGASAAPPTTAPEDADRASALQREGWGLWQKQQYADAADKFRQSVDLNPSDANAWNGLGWSQFNGGDLDPAKVAFEKCVELAPQHPAGLN